MQLHCTSPSALALHRGTIEHSLAFFVGHAFIMCCGPQQAGAKNIHSTHSRCVAACMYRMQWHSGAMCMHAAVPADQDRPDPGKMHDSSCRCSMYQAIVLLACSSVLNAMVHLMSGHCFYRHCLVQCFCMPWLAWVKWLQCQARAWDQN
jgi:hypothetical protein